MEQERVISGVKESARLNGGTLDAGARRQLEAAAARIAELTRMLEPFTASPPPAAAAAKPAKKRSPRGRRRSSRKRRPAAAKPVPVRTAHAAPDDDEEAAHESAAAFGAWGSDTEEGGGSPTAPLSPSDASPTSRKRSAKKKKKKKKASPRGRRLASPSRAAGGRLASPPRGRRLTSPRRLASPPREAGRVVSPARDRQQQRTASPPPAHGHLHSLYDGMTREPSEPEDSPAPKPVNMRYIDRLHGLHQERERNLELVRAMEDMTASRLSSPQRSRRAQNKRIQELHDGHLRTILDRERRKAAAESARRAEEEEVEAKARASRRARVAPKRRTPAEELQAARKKLQGMSYGLHGQEPIKLFQHFDRDNSGRLSMGEFRSAVRKGGKMTPAMLPDAELRRLFGAVDANSSGDIELEELVAFVWGPDPEPEPEPSTQAGRELRSPSPARQARLGSPSHAADRLLQWAEQREQKVASKQRRAAKAEVKKTPRVNRRSRTLVTEERSVDKMMDWHQEKKLALEQKRSAMADAAFERLTSPIRARPQRLASPPREAAGGWNSSTKVAAKPRHVDGIHIQGLDHVAVRRTPQRKAKPRPSTDAMPVAPSEAAAGTPTQAVAAKARPGQKREPLRLPKQARLLEVFDRWNYSGNELLSVADVDKAIDDLFPSFSARPCPALTRAAYAASHQSAADVVRRTEFTRLMKCLVYFNNIWHKFEKIDSDGDRRLNAKEFSIGCSMVGLKKDKAATAAQFSAMSEQQEDSLVPFAEFCTWCAREQLGPDPNAADANLTPEELEARRLAAEEQRRRDAERQLGEEEVDEVLAEELRKRREWLGKVSLFKDLSTEVSFLQALAKTFEVRTVSRGTVVIEKGSVGNEMCTLTAFQPALLESHWAHPLRCRRFHRPGRGGSVEHSRGRGWLRHAAGGGVLWRGGSAHQRAAQLVRPGEQGHEAVGAEQGRPREDLRVLPGCGGGDQAAARGAGAHPLGGGGRGRRCASSSGIGVGSCRGVGARASRVRGGRPAGSEPGRRFGGWPGAAEGSRAGRRGGELFGPGTGHVACAGPGQGGGLACRGGLSDRLVQPAAFAHIRARPVRECRGASRCHGC